MKVRRWPAVLLIPALLVGGALIDRNDRDESPLETDDESVTDPEAGVLQADLMPVVADPAADSSTWYCASGTGSGNDVLTSQLILIGNTTDEDRQGTVTIFPDEGERVEQEVEIGAHQRVSVATTDLTDARAASALVEIDGGGVAVTQLVDGTTGRETSECATSASDTWHVASGTTTSDAALYYAIFNPFPDEAILDMTFETMSVDGDGNFVSDGTRNPEAFQGFVVPGGSVRLVNIGEVVTRRALVSGSITARTGRVVVDRVQAYGGQAGVRGLAVSLAEPVGAESWFFPAGPAAEGIRERYVVYNPSDTEATVDLEVIVDDPATNGSVEPFELDVPGRSAVTLSTDSPQWSHVPTVGHSVVVRSLNGVAIVAERTIVVEDPAGEPGVAATAGTPLLARTWVVPTGSLASAPGNQLSLVNPDPEATAVVTLRGVADGEVFEIDELELTPGQRLSVRIDDLTDRESFVLLAESSQPVVVEETYQFNDPEERSAVRAVPLAGTTVVPDPLG